MLILMPVEVFSLFVTGGTILVEKCAVSKVNLRVS